MDVLRGIKVVDVTMYAFVPAVGGVMAHWGADVIKIENPKAPDPMRFQGGTVKPGDAGFLFKHYSRGKRSIGLDLASDEGREVLYRLVDEADVFLTSYLAETRQKLKIDVEHIRARNPNIIYVRGSGQGPKGPDAGRGGYDMAAWWCRGSLADSAKNAAGASEPFGMVGHGDGMSGMALVSGVCAALLQRERTGVASVVDGSLLGTAIWFNGLAIIHKKIGKDMSPPGGMGPASGYFRTKDDRFLDFVPLGNPDAHWVDLCEHLGQPELGSDPRFATAKDRVKNQDEGRALLEKIFAERTYDEWNKILADAKIVWAPVQTTDDLYSDPQTIANGFLREVQYPDGPLAVPVPPVLFDEEAGDPPAAPDFAAHTDEVLREIGLSEAEIGQLREKAVIV